jgi:hypothetical protein
MQVVVWSTEAHDWEDRPVAEIAAEAAAAVAPGGILLFHDGLAGEPSEPQPVTTFDRGEAVELLLAGLAERGMRPDSVSGLLAAGRAVRTAWFRP